LTEAISAVDIGVRILNPPAFYPINWWQEWRLVRTRKLPNDCYSIHLWNSRWRTYGLCPDAIYDPGCIY
jgi:hypothetical protein